MNFWRLFSLLSMFGLGLIMGFVLGWILAHESIAKRMGFKRWKM